MQVCAESHMDCLLGAYDQLEHYPFNLIYLDKNLDLLAMANDIHLRFFEAIKYQNSMFQ